MFVSKIQSIFKQVKPEMLIEELMKDTNWEVKIKNKSYVQLFMTVRDGDKRAYFVIQEAKKSHGEKNKSTIYFTVKTNDNGLKKDLESKMLDLVQLMKEKTNHKEINFIEHIFKGEIGNSEFRSICS